MHLRTEMSATSAIRLQPTVCRPGLLRAGVRLWVRLRLRVCRPGLVTAGVRLRVC